MSGIRFITVVIRVSFQIKEGMILCSYCIFFNQNPLEKVTGHFFQGESFCDFFGYTNKVADYSIASLWDWNPSGSSRIPESI